MPFIARNISRTEYNRTRPQFSFGPDIWTNIYAPVYGAAIGSTLVIKTGSTGAGTITRQWYKDGGFLSQSTGADLTLSNVQQGDYGVYTCIATNAFGSTTSRSVQVIQGSSVSVTYVSPTSSYDSTRISQGVPITITLGGSPPFTVRLRKSGIAEPIPVAYVTTGFTHTFTVTAAGTYDMIVNNTMPLQVLSNVSQVRLD
jgi:hypothetical protein